MPLLLYLRTRICAPGFDLVASLIDNINVFNIACGAAIAMFVFIFRTCFDHVVFLKQVILYNYINAYLKCGYERV